MIFRWIRRLIRWLQTKEPDLISESWLKEHHTSSHDENPKAQSRYVK